MSNAVPRVAVREPSQSYRAKMRRLQQTLSDPSTVVGTSTAEAFSGPTAARDRLASVCEHKLASVVPATLEVLVQAAEAEAASMPQEPKEPPRNQPGRMCQFRPKETDERPKNERMQAKSRYNEETEAGMRAKGEF